MTTLEAIPVPIREDAQGVLRVGETRVLLELVLRAFQRGDTPEEIADAYSTLDLADVYAVLAHYLRHREHYSAYLAAQDLFAAELRADIERTQGTQAGLRQRLLVRLDKGAKSDVAPRE